MIEVATICSIVSAAFAGVKTVGDLYSNWKTAKRRQLHEQEKLRTYPTFLRLNAKRDERFQQDVSSALHAILTELPKTRQEIRNQYTLEEKRWRITCWQLSVIVYLAFVGVLLQAYPHTGYSQLQDPYVLLKLTWGVASVAASLGYAITTEEAFVWLSVLSFAPLLVWLPLRLATSPWWVCWQLGRCAWLSVTSAVRLLLWVPWRLALSLVWVGWQLSRVSLWAWGRLASMVTCAWWGVSQPNSASLWISITCLIFVVGSANDRRGNNAAGQAALDTLLKTSFCGAVGFLVLSMRMDVVAVWRCVRCACLAVGQLQVLEAVVRLCLLIAVVVMVWDDVVVW